MRTHSSRRYLKPVAAAVFTLGWVLGSEAQTQQQPSEQRIELSQATADRLAAILPLGENASATLGRNAKQLLVDILPESSRKSCGDLVEAWGRGRNEAVLSARLLHAHREGDHLSALLAYRCAFPPNPRFDAVFDERPALLVRNGNRISLILVSPYKPEECCDPHSVEFLKSLPLTDRQLLELGVRSTSYGDGADSSSRYELVWIDDPAGNVALKIDSRTEYDGYDADTEQSHESVCDAKVRYDKDETGKLTAIVADTECTEDKVKKPSETVRYIWDSKTGHFKEVPSQPKERASAVR